MTEHWITQRAAEDRLYFSQGPMLWNDLKEALKFSVAEYHKQYVATGTQINFEACAGGDPNCVRIRRQPYNGPVDACEVKFEISKLSIGMLSVKPVVTIGLRIASEGEAGHRVQSVELFHNGKSIDVAEATQIILEPLLFPNGRHQPVSV